MPDIQHDIHERYKDRGVQVFGVSGGSVGGSGDTVEILKAFREQSGVSFPLLLNDRSFRKFEGSSDESISPYPIDVIVQDQKIVYLRREYDGAAMRAKIEELLQ